MIEGAQRLVAAVRAAAPVLAAGVLASVLLRFPPGRSSFYPQCPVYELLHLRCPGCGATRAMAALLRGRIEEAWHLNGLFVFCLPFCVGYTVVRYIGWVRNQAVPPIQPPAAAIFAATAVAAAFMAIRNLASSPF